MTKIRLKKKYRIILFFIFSTICIFGMLFSLIHIINWKKDVDSNKNVKEKIEKYITVNEKSDNIKVNFKKLKEKNEDTVAYVKVNNTKINYIVVKGKDNDYYLSHNFNKENSIAGWIFANYLNKFDETDKNIVIFGHNMKDGSMFGTLKNVLNKKWYENEDNQDILLVTEKGPYTYKVFSIYATKPEEHYINTVFNSDDEYIDFLNTIKSRSIYDYKVEVSKDDKILTLSSCTSSGTKRVALHAKLVK